MTKPDVVLLDLGNVLISIDPAAFSRTLGLDHEESRGRYRKNVIDLVHQYEAGAIASPEYFDRLGAVFEGKFSRQELSGAMLNVIGKPIEGMEDLVRSISGRTTLGLVSNTNELHFDHCRASFPVLKSFHHFFLSYRMKCLKPDPEYYRHVVQSLDIDPPQILFVDDLPENTRAAEKAGMRALLFSTTAELERVFPSLSLL
ncbi:MAG: HAD family phosphatase [Ignavibacteriales bacterium]|nr:HAD family phosphatase [Ignavibacteriales bacterium]